MKDLARQLMAGVLVAGLVLPPVLAHAQQQNQTPPQQDQAQTPPQVKPGSESDVNAIGNRKVGHGWDFYSTEKEIALGRQVAQEVDRTSKFITDPVVTEYVNKVAQNLVRNSDAQVPFTVKVIDADSINAFALPGGFFYVNSGVILAADEESEMAGVMGHEIAHVIARHATRNATKGQIAQWATIPLILLGPGGYAGYGIYQGLNVAVPLAFLKFSRDEEREADFLGLQYAYKAGYDPNGLISIFEKFAAIEKKQPGRIPKIFADHPATPDRIAAAQKEIATILPPRDEYVVSTSEFDAVKRRLQMIEAGEKAQLRKEDKSKPTLRKRTEDNPNKQTTTDQTSADDDRPVLKKRPE